MTTQSVKLSWRFVLGTILLAALAVYSGWQSMHYYDINIFIRRYQIYGDIASDGISRLEQQLSCLRAELSPGEEIGFVSPLKGIDRGEIYRWTQYALVPTIVTENQAAEKLVAIYPGEKDLEQAPTDGYTILVDCQNGVGLLSATRKE